MTGPLILIFEAKLPPLPRWLRAFAWIDCIVGVLGFLRAMFLYLS